MTSINKMIYFLIFCAILSMFCLCLLVYVKKRENRHEKALISILNKCVKVNKIEITKEVNGLQFLQATLFDGSVVELGMNSEIPYRADKLREYDFLVEGKCTYTLED